MVSPVIEMITPSPGEKDVSTNIIIEISITEETPLLGVDVSSINMSIIDSQNIDEPAPLAIKNGDIQAGFTGSITSVTNGYEISIRPVTDFPVQETVQVAIAAQDANGNHAVNKIYEFVTSDVTPPQIIDLFPAPNSIGVALDTLIKFTVIEEFKEVGVDTPTLEITIDGNSIDANDEDIVTIVENKLLNGFDIEINLPSDLPPSSEILVNYKIKDNTGNQVIQEYSFITLDEISSIFTNLDPVDGADNIDVESSIKFSIADSSGGYSGSGVNKDSINSRIEGIKAISNGEFQPGYGGTILNNPTLNGYDIEIIPNDVFKSNQTINVEVDVFDNSGNFATTSYSFRVLDDTAPIITGEQPRADAVDVSVDTRILFSIISEISAGEISLNSINVSVDGEDTIIDGEGQTGYDIEFLAADTNGITVLIIPDNPFDLNKLILMEIAAEDNVGNAVAKSYSFTTQELASLSTVASPSGGIYDNSPIGNPSFPAFNTNFNITLTSNFPSAVIFYTIDGSDPEIDQYGSPIGTTKIYTTNIISFESFTLKFFANDFINNRKESIRSEYYVVTSCPEIVKFEENDLVSGREYGRRPLPIRTNIESTGITVVQDEQSGQAIYTYDLGRSSTINALDFNNQGYVKFRIKAAEIEGDLDSIDYLGTIRETFSGIEINYDLLDIYPTIYDVDQGSLKFHGTQTSDVIFDNEAYGEIKDIFDSPFNVSIDMKLNTFGRELTGTTSFVEVLDNNNSVRIEKYLSQFSSNPNLADLLGRSSVLDEVPTVKDVYGSSINIDSNLPVFLLTDGNIGEIEISSFPPNVSDTFAYGVITETVTGFEFEKELSQEYENIIGLFAANLAVYNQFKYSDGYGDPNDLSGEVTLEVVDTSSYTIGSSIFMIVENAVLSFEVIDKNTVESTITIGVFNLTLFAIGENFTILIAPPTSGRVVGKLSNVGQTYSDAIAANIFYLLNDTENYIVGSVPIVDAKIDPYLSEVESLNRNPETDVYEYSETNGIFEGQKFLEAGTYRFRFEVEYEDGTTKSIYNPYLFNTEEDLSIVEEDDILIVLSGANTGSYPIKSVLKIGGVYSIEFVDNSFPMIDQDIESGNWRITYLQGMITTVTRLEGSKGIEVTNPLEASIVNDASGKIISFNVDPRKYVDFRFESSTARKVSLIGSFNRFQGRVDELELGFSRVKVDKIFDTDSLEGYENDHLDFNKVEMTFLRERSVDIVRFKTGVDSSDLQRTRILLDDIPISSYNYNVFKKVGTVDEYEDSFINNTDIYASEEDGIIEWRFLGSDDNNTIKRKKISLMTRIESYSGNSRVHEKFEVYSVPDSVLLTSDFLFPVDNKKVVQRINSSSTASKSSQISVKYTINNQLSRPLAEITQIRNIGLINNPFNTPLFNISGSTAQIRDDSKLSEEDSVIVSDDDGNVIFTSIVEIDETGVVTFEDSIGIVQSDKNPKVVQNYEITDDPEEKEFSAKIEVPEFVDVSIGRLRVIKDAYGEVTKVVEIDDIPEVVENLTILNNATLFYPTLRTPATVVSYERIVAHDIEEESAVIRLTLDKPIVTSNDLLGYVLRVWNSSFVVTDYIIKYSGEVIFRNESKLGISDYTIFYDRTALDWIKPKSCTHMQNLNVGDTVRIEVLPILNKVSLADISTFDLTAFNGDAGLAPESVTFTINDSFTYTDEVHEIIDGYGKGKLEGSGYDFDGQLNTGQLVKFTATNSNLFDGYGSVEDATLDKIVAEFKVTSENMYFGEIMSIVNSAPINSNCRIVINGEERHLSTTPVTNIFDRYEIQIENNFVTLLCGGESILTQPLIINKAKIRFGGTARIENDRFEADFRNLKIDQFFDISPAEFQVEGRFIRIESTLRDNF